MHHPRSALLVVLIACLYLTPQLALAQTSPFMTGATSLQTKHFKFIGTTGTGKSTAIRQLLRKAIGRGDRAVFADPDGGYCREFYQRYRGDIVLNPFEPDSVQWDLFGEIQNNYDAEQLASALIPDCEDASAREWRAYARTFLAAVIRRCYADRMHDAKELWRLLTAASAEELRPWVSGTPAQPFLDADNSRMFGSIRAVLASAIAGFEFVQQVTETAVMASELEQLPDLIGYLKTASAAEWLKVALTRT